MSLPLANAFTEYLADRGPDMLSGTGEHLLLVVLAMVIACAVALPLGVFLARSSARRLVSVVMGVASVIQPVPSLALVALVGALFVHLDLPTIGMVPGLVALVAYALLPVLRNTYTGIRQVDPTIIEVATGMGMTRRQVLWHIQLPLALPFIMTGIRIAAVWTIGVATLVSLIGSGGLGKLIFRGLRTTKPGLILSGAVPAVILALVIDWLLGRLEEWLTPAGLRD